MSFFFRVRGVTTLSWQKSLINFFFSTQGDSNENAKYFFRNNFFTLIVRRGEPIFLPSQKSQNYLIFFHIMRFKPELKYIF